MSLPTDEAPPAADELAALLRLLDDDTPEVRERVAERLALYGGDISELLSDQPRELSRLERKVLVEMLARPRRETLEREWLAPIGGAAVLREDWETFEALLRNLSDFLHDGITLRLPLSDALDMLAEEAFENDVNCACGLSGFLFEGGKLAANPEGAADPRNMDLAWSISEGLSDALGMGIIFILAAKRMGFDVEGVDFPGHFLCRVFEDGEPVIIDCLDHGCRHEQASLLQNPDLTRDERIILQTSADPGTILARVLSNLAKSLEVEDRKEDIALVQRLLETLG